MNMINWIRLNIGIKNALVLGITVLIIIGFLTIPAIYKKIKESQYQGVARVEVRNIVDKKSSFQHLNGTNQKTIGYGITYTIKISGKPYSKTELVEPGSAVKSIFDKFSSGQVCWIEVKYSLENPAESMISRLYLN